MSTGGAAINAMMNTDVAVRRHGIMITPNQPMYNEIKGPKLLSTPHSRTVRESFPSYSSPSRVLFGFSFVVIALKNKLFIFNKGPKPPLVLVLKIYIKYLIYF